MFLPEFWTNVRRASRLPYPDRIIDSPRFDAETIEQALQGDARWLAPRTVAGFAEADLGFLPDAERGPLVRHVAWFQQFAAQWPAFTPPSADQVVQALPRFRDLVVLLEFDRYGDPEAYRLGKQIELLIERSRPEALVELRFETKADHTGDPGILIWSILAEEEDEAFLTRVDEVRPLLDQAARQVVPERWPYMRFRSRSEEFDKEPTPP